MPNCMLKVSANVPERRMFFSQTMRSLLFAVIAFASASFAQTEADLMMNPRQLTFEGSRAGEGYFIADGTKMIFQSEREEGSPFYQIYLMNHESGDQERISPGMPKASRI
jgi:hypothetical protein